MAYKRKATTKPKKRVYRKKTSVPRPMKGMGDTRDFLKISMHREIFKSNFDVSSDRSMHYTLLFNPYKNVSPNTDHAANLLYHPDFSALGSLYKQYKITCIVVKLSRPNVNFMYANTSPNQTQSSQLPTIMWGTKVLHSTITYNPDGTTNAVQSNTTLQPRVNTIAPNSWRESVDDGQKLFHNHGYKRTCTRVWKPVGAFEKRWRRVDNDDAELARGGLHIRFENDRLLELEGNTATNNNWNYRENSKILDVEATIYMHYKDRM